MNETERLLVNLDETKQTERNGRNWAKPGKNRQKTGIFRQNGAKNGRNRAKLSKKRAKTGEKRANETKPWQNRAKPKVSPNLGSGSVIPGFKYGRNKVKPLGKSYWRCLAEGCRAGLRADYSSKDNSNIEEPRIDLNSIPPASAHCLRDGALHTV